MLKSTPAIKTNSSNEEEINVIAPPECFKYNPKTKRLTRIDGNHKTKKVESNTDKQNCLFVSGPKKIKKVVITSAKQVSFSKKIEQIPPILPIKDMKASITTPTKASKFQSVTKLKSCREHVKTPFKKESLNNSLSDEKITNINTIKLYNDQNNETQCKENFTEDTKRNSILKQNIEMN